MVNTDKAYITIKTQIKKGIDIEKKVLEKREKIKENKKAKLKEDVLQMRKLVASNKKTQIGIFKTLLSDPLIGGNFHNDLFPYLTRITLTLYPNLLLSASMATAYLTYQTNLQAKKAVLEILAQKLGRISKEKTSKRKKTPTAPSTSIELIRPESKQKVRLIRIATESTFFRCMRRLGKNIDKDEDINEDIDKGMDINNT